MKKQLYLFVLFFVPCYISAQNVGVGTTTPTEQLEVKRISRSTLKISSESYNDTTQLLLSNRTAGNAGTDFSLKNIREEGLFFSSLSDVPANNFSNSLVIRPNGNIGTGIIPTAKLHVNGGIKMEGLNLFEFGSGIAGKEINAGKVGYNAFGATGLTFVGAGTTAANRAFYFFGEGGTTFNGPATINGNTNIGGQLQINGSPGTAGQVLTSNGGSDPSWKNASLTNDTRFGTLFTKNAASRSGDAAMSTLLYNLNPTNVSIGASAITINKTGLYHFDIGMSSGISYTAAPTVYPQHELWLYFGLPNSLKLIEKQMVPYANTNTSWVGQEKVSVDVYITAPANLHFSHNLGELGGGTVSSYSVQGFVTGYLISE